MAGRIGLDSTPGQGSRFGLELLLEPGTEGRSMADLLIGRRQAVRGPRDIVGLELFYRRAVRQGDWKATWLPGDPIVSPTSPGVWELFNLKRDPGETQDLAETHLRRLESLVRAWEGYATRNGVVLPPQ
jgi:arylsulfatase